MYNRLEYGTCAFIYLISYMYTCPEPDGQTSGNKSKSIVLVNTILKANMGLCPFYLQLKP